MSIFKGRISLGFDDEAYQDQSPLTLREKIKGWCILLIIFITLLAVCLGIPLALMRLGASWWCKCL